MSDQGGAQFEPSPTPSTTAAPASPAPTPEEDGDWVPFNCRTDSGVDYAVGWTQDKRDHCCKLERLGCESDPYDCDADFPNWSISWSDGKKAWCCIVYQRGC